MSELLPDVHGPETSTPCPAPQAGQPLQAAGARAGVLPLSYAAGRPASYREGVMTFDRLVARARALPPIVADLLVVAVVGVFTTADAAVNEPGYRQADALTWALLVVSWQRSPAAAVGPFRWSA